MPGGGTAARAPAPHAALANLLGAVEGERARELGGALETLGGHTPVWPDSKRLLRVVGPLRQTWGHGAGAGLAADGWVAVKTP